MKELFCLRKQVAQCLAIETRSIIELKIRPKRLQWNFLIQAGGLRIAVGKGSDNTCFVQIGDRERETFFPDELLLYLDKLCERKYVSFYASDSTSVKEAKNISVAKFNPSEAQSLADKSQRYLLGVTHEDVFVPIKKRIKSVTNELVWEKYENQ